VADITSIPAARVPVLEPGSNIMSREWYRFLFNQFGQTGSGTTDISIDDLALAPFSDAETEAALGQVRDDVQGLLSAAPIYRPVPRRAAFANSATQTTTANTATAVTFNVTTFTNGVGLASSSQVSPGQAGDYLISYRVQFDKTSGGDSPTWVWLRKNGVDLANTTAHWHVKGSESEAALSTSILLQLGQTDYLQLMWATSDSNVILLAPPATAYSPAGPSALLNIIQVDP
jgi:hypothetical protein